MTWPKQVPVLKPEDFVVGPWEKGCRLCLLGWKRQVFGVGDKWLPTTRKLMAAAGDDFHTITHMDTPDTPTNRRLAARIWAEFIERLGYTEDGPIVDL